MFSSIAATAVGHGIWDSDTVGLLFVYGILIPALTTGLIVVAIVSGRGDQRGDDELRTHFRRKYLNPED